MNQKEIAVDDVDGQDDHAGPDVDPAGNHRDFGHIIQNIKGKLERNYNIGIEKDKVEVNQPCQ